MSQLIQLLSTVGKFRRHFFHVHKVIQSHVTRHEWIYLAFTSCCVIIGTVSFPSACLTALISKLWSRASVTNGTSTYDDIQCFMTSNHPTTIKVVAWYSKFISCESLVLWRIYVSEYMYSTTYSVSRHYWTTFNFSHTYFLSWKYFK